MLQIEPLEAEAEERLIEASRAARAEEYRRIAAEAEEAVEPAAQAGAGRADRTDLRDLLEKLRRRLAEVSRIDYFHAAEQADAAAALDRLEAALAPGGSAARDVPAAELSRYRGRRWVTRPRPHVDRLASAWLIRRFIDPQAEIFYREAPEEGEIPFDMRGAELGHRGNRCTFETLIGVFGLAGDPALAALAEIVHEIDLRDGVFSRPEIPGVDGLLRGWRSAGWPDAELERHGLALFEGLYLALRQPPAARPRDRRPARPRAAPPRPAAGKSRPKSRL